MVGSYMRHGTGNRNFLFRLPINSKSVESNQLSSWIKFQMKSSGQSKHLKYLGPHYKNPEAIITHHCPGRKLQGDQRLNESRDHYHLLNLGRLLPDELFGILRKWSSEILPRCWISARNYQQLGSWSFSFIYKTMDFSKHGTLLLLLSRLYL